MSIDSSGPILVVDDDDGFRSYLVELLAGAGYRTRQVSKGGDVLEVALEERPSAVLLDIQLPGLNGYEVCRRLRDVYADSVAIVFLSGERAESLDRAAGFLLGADDHLGKPVDGGELVARIRRLLERTVNGGRPSDHGKLAVLTPREHEVLDLLAEGYRQSEIAAKLVISPKTVATHIQHILSKLEVRSRAQAVAVALGKGANGDS
jgi:two-component system response regulator FixJ